MSYAMRAAVIAGFFPFYYRQHAGSCFIGAFDCVTALLGYVLPSLNLPSGLGSPEAPAGSVYLACSTPPSSRLPLQIPGGLRATGALSPRCIFLCMAHKHPYLA